MATVLVVDSMQRFWFFRRLADSLKGEHKFVFLCSEPLSAIFAKLLGYPSHYIRRTKASLPTSIAEMEHVRNCIEVINGDISEEEASHDFRSVFQSCASLLKQIEADRIVVWNGQQLVARAAALAARKSSVDARFLEISNLPGKLFADPLGVNALSQLQSNPAVLDPLPVCDEAVHQDWIRQYEVLKSLPPPQSKVSARQKIVSILNQALKRLSSGVCQRSLRSLRASVPILASHADSRLIDSSELASTNYVFLPLQVSGDTQLKLHSDVDNLAALRIAHQKARELDAHLLVKVHPAEFDRQTLQAIDSLHKELGFQLIHGPITDVLKYARLVITINSTVGLEALIYDKELLTLGRAFYQNFDKIRLRQYIHEYLIPADYFGHGQLDPDAAKRIIGIK